MQENSVLVLAQTALALFPSNTNTQERRPCYSQFSHAIDFHNHELLYSHDVQNLCYCYIGHAVFLINNRIEFNCTLSYAPSVPVYMSPARMGGLYFGSLERETNI